MLALHSETTATVPTAAITFTTRQPGIISTGGPFTGTVALTTPAAPGPHPPLPMRPIWIGLAVNTVFFAVCWLVIWKTLTVPRRFLREVARMRRGACVCCGYDLGYDFIRGCPECGWRRSEDGPRSGVMDR
jgi:hypothetical protein